MTSTSDCIKIWESFINISDDLKKSRDTVIQKIQNLNWENGFFRKDIGFKIIDK